MHPKPMRIKLVRRREATTQRESMEKSSGETMKAAVARQTEKTWLLLVYFVVVFGF
jgi:hypothetical protein